ncbi:MAG: lipid-A-disaccharide synthase [Bryobacteraceae bacterium]
MPPKILISAGEASGDRYAAALAARLQRLRPDLSLFGCTGPEMRKVQVRTVVDSASLAVVGLVEVVSHIPRIYSEYRKLLQAAERERPDVAILTDSPDFHLRVAKRLKRMGIPVIYLVAPQVWAWRKGRVHTMRRILDRLLCIFPFEEEFFRGHGIRATYIGHPLTTSLRIFTSREEFFRKHRLALDRPLVVVLPGSRRGEAARHLPAVADAADRIYRERAVNFVLPASAHTGAAFFRDRMGAAPIHVIEGETWDAIAHADVALAASGTVTVEAALLGTPLVTFYKVALPSWIAGKLLVRVPFYCMVNLVAGRQIVTEWMQSEMTGSNLASATLLLLDNAGARERMKQDLKEVAARLTVAGDPMDRAAEIVEGFLYEKAKRVEV